MNFTNRRGIHWMNDDKDEGLLSGGLMTVGLREFHQIKQEKNRVQVADSG